MNDYMRAYSTVDVEETRRMMARLMGRYSWTLPTPQPEPKFTTDSRVQLDIAFLTADDVTVAQLTSPNPNYGVYRGAAKRHADDAQDDTIGGSLALARLLRNYADALEKSALKLSRE